ncbi:hypothetical protein GO495_12645 [Chitinophaga oryziterrae]|uniref:PNPLA domain-containing protein n=1 Tax=Chitinophaga oryziterrae TaxID=1031224 RepID=A0A6N8J876_9BACT|nr:patatin-like phospholipase family protein [Chitinophaga oryziterrae]MVT41437.1 hypothetical protein [Chitinophaga oryziterrae]
MSEEILTTPFKKIAMALSGGGFRAASFSLGAMSYLHYLKYPGGDEDARMLDNVEFISSASGGTFTGILYSMHIMKGITFEKTYQQLFNFMNGQVLLGDILKRINDDSKWKGDKSRNLINAFAGVYNEELFEGETFGVYWPKGENKRNIEVCFNTTEFYRGISFRFQAASNINPNPQKQAIAGNKYVYFENEETLKKIRLGDIMAASSCFPAGFEPILYPKDFTYESLNEDTLRQALTMKDYNDDTFHPVNNMGLMDGGIDDNQGVFGALLANQRREKDNAPFDLFFITDVASYFMEPYKEPAVSTKGKIRGETVDSLLGPFKRKFFAIRRFVNWGFFIAVILLIASIFGLTYIHDVSLGVLVFSATLLLPLMLAKKIFSNSLAKGIADMLQSSEEDLIKLIKKQVPSTENFSDNTLSLLLKYLKRSRIGVLELMLKTRLNSVLSMVMDINLKQTRRLIFNIFYGDFYDNNKLGSRGVFNVIYELSLQNKHGRQKFLRNKFGKDIPLLTEGCEALNKVAESARTVETSLWYDKEDQKNKRINDVVACGQFTTCAKLLEYIFFVEKTLNDPKKANTIVLDAEQLVIFKSVKEQLLRDWERFKIDPYFQVIAYNRFL